MPALTHDGAQTRSPYSEHGGRLLSAFASHGDEIWWWQLANGTARVFDVEDGGAMQVLE